MESRPTSSPSRGYCVGPQRFDPPWNLASGKNRFSAPWPWWNNPCLFSKNSLRNIRTTRRFSFSRFRPVTARSAISNLPLLLSSLQLGGVKHVTDVIHQQLKYFKTVNVFMIVHASSWIVVRWHRTFNWSKRSQSFTFWELENFKASFFT